MDNSFFSIHGSKHSRTLLLLIMAVVGGILIDLMIYNGFHPITLKEQIIILFATGLALFLLDYPYFRQAMSMPKILVSLMLICLGVALLSLVIVFPRITAWQSLENTLPNILVAIGLVVLFLAAYLRSITQPVASSSTKWFWLIALSGLTFWLSHDLFNYMLVCTTSMLAGKGLSRLLGKHAFNQRSLRPFLTLVFWAILIGFGVGIGIPMKIWSTVIWLLTIGLVIWGIKQTDQEPLFEPIDLLIFLLPLLIVFPYTVYGFSNYAGNPSSDGWNYIASGQALWETSRCATDAQMPMYQFGIRLSCYTRYMSFGFLSFFSNISGTPGDTQPSASIYIPWLFFIYTSALRFFAESRKESERIVIAYLVVGALAGWPLQLMISNNFDNLLLLGYLPAISGLILLGNFSRQWNILMGIVLAAVLYGYPELSPFIFFAVGLLILERWHQLRSNRPGMAVTTATILLTALLAVSPYIQTAVSFLAKQLQLSSNTTGPRPGGEFASELVHANTWFVALWGMGGPIAINPYTQFFDAVRILVGLGFLLGLIVGIIVLWRKREFALLGCFVFFASATAYYLVFKQYGYAGYKLLNMSWWLFAYLILNGSLALYRRFTLPPTGKAWALGGVICLYLAGCFITAENLYLLPIRQIAPYRDITNISIPSEKTLVVAVQNDQAALWAAYYLRNRPAIYRMSSPRNVAQFAADVDLPSVILPNDYLLTDKSTIHSAIGESVWQNSIYKLIKLSDKWVWLQNINTPNQIETVNDKPFFWMGGGPTILSIESSVAQNIQIIFNGSPGPSLPETSERHLQIISKNFNHVILLSNGINSFSVPLHVGKNSISLKIMEQPSVKVMPNGDTRPLMLSVSDLEIKK